MINPAQRQQLDTDGYVVLERLLSPETLAEVRARVEELYAAEGENAGPHQGDFALLDEVVPAEPEALGELEQSFATADQGFATAGADHDKTPKIPKRFSEASRINQPAPSARERSRRQMSNAQSGKPVEQHVRPLLLLNLSKSDNQCSWMRVMANIIRHIWLSTKL